VPPSKTRFGEGTGKVTEAGTESRRPLPSTRSVGPVESVSVVLEAATTTMSATGNRKPASVSPYLLLLLLLFILFRGRASKNDNPDPKSLSNLIVQPPERYY
jgi:hypothetical protein